MAVLKIDSVADFINCEGMTVGPSEFLVISQEMIDKFADATKDHQWIHIDSQRAKSESPFGTTIAHGYLILSFLPYFLNQILQIENLDRIVNYGIEKMVFKSPLPSGNRLRMRATIISIKDLGVGCVVTLKCIFETEGSEKPVLEGNIKYIYYFNN